MRISNRYLLTALLLLFSGVVVADTTCNMVNGVYVCGDGSGGSNGSICITNTTTGVTACCDSNGASCGGSSSGGSSGLNLGGGLGHLLDLPAPAPGSGWLSKLTYWIAYAIHVVFAAFVGVLKDLVTFIVGCVLALASTAINAIGTPSWISQYSLGNTLGQTGGVVLFFMGSLQIPLALSLVGLGYVFRLIRKFLTLFQW